MLTIDARVFHRRLTAALAGKQQTLAEMESYPARLAEARKRVASTHVPIIHASPDYKSLQSLEREGIARRISALFSSYLEEAGKIIDKSLAGIEGETRDNFGHVEESVREVIANTLASRISRFFILPDEQALEANAGVFIVREEGNEERFGIAISRSMLEARDLRTYLLAAVLKVASISAETTYL